MKGAMKTAVVTGQASARPLPGGERGERQKRTPSPGTVVRGCGRYPLSVASFPARLRRIRARLVGGPRTPLRPLPEGAVGLPVEGGAAGGELAQLVVLGP